MFNRDTWIEILQTILKNPLRYILTGISMAVGIFILVFLLGMSSGLSNGVAGMFDRVAINSLSLEAGRTTLPYQGTKVNRRIDFSDYDQAKINEDHDDEIPTGSAIDQMWSVRMIQGKQSDNYSLSGVNSTFFDLGKLELLHGRFLNYNDEIEARKVVVLGTTIHKDLCKGRKVIGELISIGGVQFKIIGVFKRGESRWNNRKAYIPIQTYHKLFSSTDRIDEFLLSTGDMNVDNTVVLENELLEEFQTRHKVNPADKNAIYTENNNVESKEYTDVIIGIKLFVLVIGLMTLISGIIGISNIMSIVVKERTRELGVRKAIGATPNKIVGLILQESLLITVLSGFIGMILGIGLLELISEYIDIEFFKNPAVDFNTAMISLLILVLSGVVAGLVPSIRAARLKPIAALRDE